MDRASSSLGILWAVLAAACLRLADLGGPSLTVDEGVVAYFASFPGSQMLQAMAQVGEVHPPGFFLLVQAVYGWTHSDFWLRALCSVLPSLATVPLYFAIFRKERYSLEVSWALALSSVAVFYGRELRMYPWLALWAVLCLGSYYRFLRGGDKRWLVGYVVGFGAALWFHYFALLLPATALAWSRSRRYLAWLGGTLVGFLPWGLLWFERLLSQLGGQDLELRGRPWALGLPDWWGRMMVGDLGPSGWPYSYFFAGLCGVTVALGWSRWRRFHSEEPELFSFAVCWALVGPTLAFLVSTLTSIRVFEYKYFLFCLPGVALLVLVALPGPARWALLVLNIATLAFLVFVPYGQGQDWRGVAAQLQSAGDEVTVLVHPSMMAAPLLHYGVSGRRLTPLDRPPVETLVAILQARPRVWLVITPHHPFVVRSGLENFISATLQRESSWESHRFLPSAELRIVRFKGPLRQR